MQMQKKAAGEGMDALYYISPSIHSPTVKSNVSKCGEHRTIFR